MSKFEATRLLQQEESTDTASQTCPPLQIALGFLKLRRFAFVFIRLPVEPSRQLKVLICSRCLDTRQLQKKFAQLSDPGRDASISIKITREKMRRGSFADTPRETKSKRLLKPRQGVPKGIVSLLSLALNISRR